MPKHVQNERSCKPSCCHMRIVLLPFSEVTAHPAIQIASAETERRKPRERQDVVVDVVVTAQIGRSRAARRGGRIPVEYILRTERELESARPIAQLRIH